MYRFSTSTYSPTIQFGSRLCVGNCCRSWWISDRDPFGFCRYAVYILAGGMDYKVSVQGIFEELQGSMSNSRTSPALSSQDNFPLAWQGKSTKDSQFGFKESEGEIALTVLQKLAPFPASFISGHPFLGPYQMWGILPSNRVHGMVTESESQHSKPFILFITNWHPFGIFTVLTKVAVCNHQTFSF